jgi:glycosyltransferase involved in cell wall biosynthesis
MLLLSHFELKSVEMKILFVIDTYYTNNNGTSISAQRFASELRKRGHEVRILTANDSGENDENLFSLRHFHMPIFQPLMNKHNFNFAKFWGKESLEVIHAAIEWADIVHNFLPFPLEAVAKRYAEKIGKPNTAAAHLQAESLTANIGLHRVAWVNHLFYKIFRKLLFDGVRHVHCPSQFMADEVKSHGFTGKMHPISNGIQPVFIEAGKRHIAGHRTETYDEYKGKILIMMVGRLTREKQQALIIKAVPYSKYADRIQLIFAGRGPMQNSYEKLGQTLPLKPQFVYLKRDALIEMLSQSDLYVHAADMESEAISCIEAFATGLVPVIANSPLSATKQFALDERSLFKAGDAQALARAIDYWLDNTEERLRMEEVYAASAEKYSIDHSIDLFEEMLKEEIEDNEKAQQHIL